MQPFGHNGHWLKIGGCVPLGEGRDGSPPTHNVAWAESYLRTKWHPDTYGRLAKINIGRRLGAMYALLGRELGPHVIQCRLGRGLTLYQVAS